MKLRKFYVFVAIAAILFMLNPSLKQFKEFTEQPEIVYKDKYDALTELDPLKITRRKTHNYLFFSFFELGFVDVRGNYFLKQKYLGFCFNFFERGNSVFNDRLPGEKAIDSTAPEVDTTMSTF